jgi:hypothetical protein
VIFRRRSEPAKILRIRPNCREFDSLGMLRQMRRAVCVCNPRMAAWTIDAMMDLPPPKKRFIPDILDVPDFLRARK